MANESYKAGEGSLWVQPGGPNSTPQYLGCHSVGDIAEPRGDITLLYCPDEKATGKFKIDGSFQSAPGPVTTTLTTKVYQVADWLESIRCAVPLYIVKQKCGRRDVFANYERTYVIDGAVINNATLSSMLAMTPDDEGESQQSFDISGVALLRFWKILGARQSISDTEGQLAITFLDTQSCPGGCGAPTDLGSTGYMGGKTLAGSGTNLANVLKTVNGGGSWAAASASPFGGGYAIAAIVAFMVSTLLHRVVVAQGTNDVANPAKIAYSQDSGATWTSVSVGAVNGQYFKGPRSLIALNQYNLWSATSGGYIYQSTDGGVTWTVKDAGIISGAADLNAISFSDGTYGLVGGDTNSLARTSDGGLTWCAIAAPAAEAGNVIKVVQIIDSNRAWIGYSNGHLYCTSDLQSVAPTWTSRSIGITAAAINDLRFINELTAYLVANVSGTGGHLLRSIDGGYTWEDLSLPTNVGLNSVYPVSLNQAFIVGEATGGTGVVIKVS